MNHNDDFVWGVASSAYQTEGASTHEGKGASIWDDFTSKKGKILLNQNAIEACNFYHRYPADLKLMNTLGIENFRFSISWPRVLPNGIGEVNTKGLDFYDRLVDECLENKINPWITLYHWDLPSQLEQKGGWVNREIINWFNEYISIVANKLADRVNKWMVLNEPMVFTGAGYFLGVHAPGKKGPDNFLRATHHTALCQSSTIRILKELMPNSEVGTTFSCSYITPYSQDLKDREAAIRVDTLLNRLFIEPLLGYGYPIDRLPFLSKIEKFMKPDDYELLKAIPDFIGVQNYTREVVKHSMMTPYLRASIVAANKRNVKSTVMNWEVFPESLYQMINQFNEYPEVKKIYVTENGAAFNDLIINNNIHDAERISYLKSCISEMNRAKKEGARVNGYFVWSFTDNFEWTEGYLPRFGIVHVDYKTQKRTVKDSGYWYSNFLKNEKETKFASENLETLFNNNFSS